MCWLLGEKANTNTFAYTANVYVYIAHHRSMYIYARMKQVQPFLFSCFVCAYLIRAMPYAAYSPFSSHFSLLHTGKTKVKFETDNGEFGKYILLS